MPRSFAKPKKFEKISDLLESRDIIDLGEMDVVAQLKEIPTGSNQKFESEERKFGCLPWRLEFRKVMEPPVEDGNRDKCLLKVSLRSPFHENAWSAKASGILTLEKWPEKVKGQSEQDQKSEHSENFTHIFNQQKSYHDFLHLFPIPTRNSHLRGGVNQADSPYIKNGHFKFRLEIVIHSVRKINFPFYDFHKKTPMCNAIVKITDNNGVVQRFNVNKEYLSMFSEALNRMFNNTGFLEGRTNEVELKNTDCTVFREFLNIIYPGQHRPHIRYVRGLLEFARMYFIPTVTAKCEQRLLEAEDTDMSKTDRLKLADQYGLYLVVSKIMQHLKLKELNNNYEGFSPELLQMLLRRQKHCESEAEEAMDVDKPACSSSTHRKGRRADGNGSRSRARGTGRSNVARPH